MKELDEQVQKSNMDIFISKFIVSWYNLSITGMFAVQYIAYHSNKFNKLQEMFAIYFIYQQFHYKCVYAIIAATTSVTIRNKTTSNKTQYNIGYIIIIYCDMHCPAQSWRVWSLKVGCITQFVL